MITVTKLQIEHLYLNVNMERCVSFCLFIICSDTGELESENWASREIQPLHPRGVPARASPAASATITIADVTQHNLTV